MFGILTKIDLLKDPVADIVLIEEALAEHLGVAGIDNKIFCTSLYNQNVTPGMKRNRDINRTMCLFMVTIITNIYQGHKPKGILGLIR